MVTMIRPPMGYGDPTQPHRLNILQDRRGIDVLQDTRPHLFMPRGVEVQQQDVYKRILDMTYKRGGSPGSLDLQAIFEVVFGDDWDLLAQLIGSCVQSGDLRVMGTRELWEVAVLGDLERLFGLMRLGPRSLFHWGPFSYGWGRKLANIRGGDGSFCETQVRADTEIGFIPCSSPKIATLMQQYGVDVNNERNYPEPQGNNGMKLYRACGDWKHIEDLRSEVVAKLVEVADVHNAGQLEVCILQRFMPVSICSDWAFKLDYIHPELGPVYTRNRNDSWPHNMSLCAIFVDSKGRKFAKDWNSWEDVHDGRPSFLVELDEADDWLRDAVAIAKGETQLPDVVASVA